MLILWITKDKETIWVEIEQIGCPTMSLESLPFTTKTVQRDIIIIALMGHRVV